MNFEIGTKNYKNQDNSIYTEDAILLNFYVKKFCFYVVYYIILLYGYNKNNSKEAILYGIWK